MYLTNSIQHYSLCLYSCLRPVIGNLVLVHCTMLKTSMKSTITAITEAVGFERKPCIQLLPPAGICSANRCATHLRH